MTTLNFMISQVGAAEKASKKKIAKGGADVVGETTKKCFVPSFVSPRKKLMAKPLSKMGDKGGALIKKASVKPKNSSD